jgi:2TM domain
MADERTPGTQDAIEVVDEREAAGRRLQARRDFGTHLVSYLVVNAFLVGIWAFTGAGYFWPIWVIGGWGIGLVLHAWDVFWRRPLTEADIDAELRRHRR